MKDDILKYVIKTNMWYESCGVTPISIIARQFNITKYKARKYVKEMIAEGLLELAIAPGCFTEDGPYPPIKGYKATESVEQSVLYKEMEKKQSDDFEKICIGY